jgi:hypothetical protein
MHEFHSGVGLLCPTWINNTAKDISNAKVIVGSFKPVKM